MEQPNGKFHVKMKPEPSPVPARRQAPNLDDIPGVKPVKRFSGGGTHGPHPVSIEIELGEKTAIASVSQFKGVWYLSIRYTYTDENGQVMFGKNGINMPIDDGIDGINAMLLAYNEATGSHLILKGGDEDDNQS